MADVRQLTFSIGYNIKDDPIKKANDSVDDYKDTVIKSERTTQKLGSTVRSTGQKMQTLGSRSVRAAKDGQSAFESFNRRMKVIGGAVLGYFSFRAIARSFKTVISATAELEEETAKFNIVFGDLSEEADRWSRDFADAVGRSVNETTTLLASNQNLLVGFGATREQGFEMAKAVQTLGTDLASMNNLVDTDVINSMSSAMLGNHLAAKSLGIAITESTLALEMQKLGIKGTFAELDPLTKMQVRFAVMVSQSQDAMGNAEATAGSYTNQLKRLRGNFADAIAQGSPLNEQLTEFFVLINENFDVVEKFIADGIDVAAKALEVFGEVMIFANENSETLIPIMAGLTAGFAAFKIIGVIVPIVTTLISAFSSMGFAVAAVTGGAATLMEGMFLLMGPIGWVALAIGAVVAIGVALIRNWDEIKAAGAAVFEFLTDLGTEFVTEFGRVLGAFIDLLIIIPINTAIKLLNKIKIDIPDFIPDIGGQTIGFDIPTIPQLTIPEFARGTRNAPRGLAIMNESTRGEVVSFAGGEQVRTAAEAGAMTRNTTNQIARPQITININGAGESGVAMGKEIKKELEQWFNELGVSLGVSL